MSASLTLTYPSLGVQRSYSILVSLLWPAAPARGLAVPSRDLPGVTTRSLRVPGVVSRGVGTRLTPCIYDALECAVRLSRGGDCRLILCQCWQIARRRR